MQLLLFYGILQGFLAFDLLIDLNDLYKVCGDRSYILFKFFIRLIFIVQTIFLLVVMKSIWKGLQALRVL